MNGHLNDEQWAAIALGEFQEEAAQHLAKCLACREEIAAFFGPITRLQAQSVHAAVQPEAFWNRQRVRIDARLGACILVRRWKRWGWVAATITLIVLAATLLSNDSTRPQRTTVQPDPDDVLLLSVQQSIQSDLPQALRPAALLTREIDRAEKAQQKP